MRPERIDTLDDVKQWVHDHDGRIDAWWDAQHAANARYDAFMATSNKQLAELVAARTVADTEFEKIDDRLSSVEKKVMFYSGVAAAMGALLGGLFPL